MCAGYLLLVRPAMYLHIACNPGHVAESGNAVQFFLCSLVIAQSAGSVLVTWLTVQPIIAMNYCGSVWHNKRKAQKQKKQPRVGENSAAQPTAKKHRFLSLARPRMIIYVFPNNLLHDNTYFHSPPVPSSPLPSYPDFCFWIPTVHYSIFPSPEPPKFHLWVGKSYQSVHWRPFSVLVFLCFLR